MTDDTHIPTVALIHGTFAANSPWPADSLLSKRLREGLFTYRIITPHWTGRNSPEDRAAAATSLSEMLAKEMANRKGPLFLIGHSHGGLAAVMSLHDDAIRDKVVGIITLGTPFITCNERDHSTFRALRYVAYLLICLIVAEAGVRLFSLGWSDASNQQILRYSLLFLSAIAFGGIEKSVFFQTFLKRALLNGYEKFTYPHADVPVLCLQDVADEAFGLLATISSLATLPLFLGTLLYRLLAWIFAPFLILVGGWLVIHAAMNGFPSPPLEQTQALNPILELGIVVGMWVFVLMAGVVFLGFGVIALLQPAGIGFGRTDLGTYLTLNVRVQRTPPNLTRVEIRQVRIQRTFAGLVHCQFYNDEKCVALIEQWLKEKVRAWRPIDAPNGGREPGAYRLNASQPAGPDQKHGPTASQFRQLQAMCVRSVSSSPCRVKRCDDGSVVFTCIDSIQLSDPTSVDAFLLELVTIDPFQTPIQVTKELEKIMSRFRDHHAIENAQV